MCSWCSLTKMEFLTLSPSDGSGHSAAGKVGGELLLHVVDPSLNVWVLGDLSVNLVEDVLGNFCALVAVAS